MQTNRLPGACRAIQSAARESPAGLVGNCPFDSIAPVAAATTARLWVAACVSTPITYSNSCATTAIGSSLLRSPTRSVPVLGKTFRGGSLRSHAHPLRAGRTSFYQAIATDGSAPTPRRGQVRRKTQEVLVRKLKSHAPRGRSQPASRPQASQKPLEVTDPLSGTVLDVGRTRYRPPPGLDAHVRTRDGTCVRPGCPTSAWSCDLDHTVPSGPGPDGASGGPAARARSTSADNLGALCRRDHLLKTHGGFRLSQVAPGVFEWTTPTGHRYPERGVPALPKRGSASGAGDPSL